MDRAGHLGLGAPNGQVTLRGRIVWRALAGRGMPITWSAPSLRSLLASPTVRVWSLTATLTALAVVIFVGADTRLQPVAAPFGLAWPMIAVGFFLAESKVVNVHFRRETHSFSLSELPAVLGLFFLGSTDYMLALMCGTAAAFLVGTRPPAIKLAFNLANYALIGVASLLIFHAISSEAAHPGPIDWLAAFLTTLVATVMAAVTIATAISLSGGAPQYQKLPEMLQFGGVVACANTSLALLAVSMLLLEPMTLWLLGPPVVAVFLAYAAYVSEREKHERLELLYESSRILQRSPELDSALVALLEHARGMFRAEMTEIQLFSDDGSADTIRTLCRVDLPPQVMVPHVLPLTSTLRSRAGSGNRAFLAGQLDSAGDGRTIHQAMVAPLIGEHQLIGVMIVANRMGEGSRYATDDLRLLETLANQAAVALENGQLEQSLAELTRLKEQLDHLAYHDPLTGLGNRWLFVEQVELRLRSAETGSLPIVFFLDLDDFKVVNDTLGHEAGDKLLAAVGERITSCLREGDIAARLGGDEFAVLLGPGTGMDAAVGIAMRLLDEIGASFHIAGEQIVGGVSIGIAAARSATETATELLRDADVAMYTAKSDGKRRFAVFEPTIHRAIVARHELGSQLASGILRNELEVFYQPIVDLANGRIHGIEALVRWHHPVRGIVEPDEFIRLAEENGSILALGRVVLAESCRVVRGWQRSRPAGTRLRLAVNLSSRQLQHADFLAEMSAVLEETGFDPRDLVLEMTETVMFHDVEATIAKLLALKARGVRIAVDDFGTGYSSLGYLRRFPVDVLKIAREFIDIRAGDMSTSAQTWSFAEAIIALGRTLGLSMVAEGIEEPDQLDRVRRLGCDLGQGFLFSRPVTATRLASLLDDEDAGRSPWATSAKASRGPGAPRPVGVVSGGYDPTWSRELVGVAERQAAPAAP